MFNKTFWFVVIVLMLGCGLLMKACDFVRDDYFSDRISISLFFGNTDAAAERMHDRFMDVYRNDTAYISSSDGAIAEKVIHESLKHNDVESAKMVFAEYQHALSEYKRSELYDYMTLHNLPDADKYK